MPQGALPLSNPPQSSVVFWLNPAADPLWLDESLSLRAGDAAGDPMLARTAERRPATER